MTRLLILSALLSHAFLPASVVLGQDSSSPYVQIPVAAVTEQLDASAGPATDPLSRLEIRERLLAQQAGADSYRHQPLLLPETNTAPKSVLQAVLYSLLLPGMGELYAGRLDRGLYPLVAEGLLWTGFAGFNLYGGWIQDDARTFALRHAGVKSLEMDDQFFVNIGNYNSLDHYNSTKLIERDLGAVYEGGPSSTFYWNWDTEGSRLEYKDQRIHSDQMYNAAKFVVLGLVANRVWSAIQSALIVKSHNASLTALPEIRTGLISGSRPADGIFLHISQRF